jgi:hypothetical protein
LSTDDRLLAVGQLGRPHEHHQALGVGILELIDARRAFRRRRWCSVTIELAGGVGAATGFGRRSGGGSAGGGAKMRLTSRAQI